MDPGGSEIQCCCDYCEQYPFGTVTEAGAQTGRKDADAQGLENWGRKSMGQLWAVGLEN